MPTAKKLPSGSWRCQVYSHTEEILLPDGSIKKKRIYESFTSDISGPKGKRIAEQMAADFAAKKDSFSREKSNLSFKDAMNDYITIKEPVLSPATIKSYNNIKKILLTNFSDFCNKKITFIKQEDIQRVIDRLAMNKSPKTVRNYHGLITAVLSSSGSTLLIKTTLPQKIPPKLYIPSDSEIQRLVDAVEGTELEVPVMLGAFCTMRRGEICALSVKDINGRLIHVHKSMVYGTDRKWHLKAPKNVSSDRFIEAPQFVIDRIAELGYITHLNPHSITIMFGRILKMYSIPHFRFHDLRHYSASIKHALGIPDAYIMADGGWNSDIVLKNVYRHALDDRRKEMAEKANNHFNKIYNTKCNTKNKNP